MVAPSGPEIALSRSRLAAFQRRFPDDRACSDYLFASRWAGGYRCPRCGHGQAWPVARRRLVWECTACHRQTSVTAGTVLHKTRTPLHLWFWAAYLLGTATPGLSAVRLQRELGIDRYETSWQLLHALRRAMVRLQQGPLTGTVELDECSIGRVLVVVAVEVRGSGCGRARMRVVEEGSAPAVEGFLRDSVSVGSTVRTGGRPGYRGLSRCGYRHWPGLTTPALPRARRVIEELTAWLRVTHRGVSVGHLPAYLEEFTFRFDRRHHPMEAVHTLLGLGSAPRLTRRRELTRTPIPTSLAGWLLKP